MNQIDLINALAKSDLYHGLWFLDDDHYDGLSAAFIVEAHEAWCHGLPPQLTSVIDRAGKTITLPRWNEENFDCDNIAKDFATYVDRCMAVEAVRTAKPRGNAAIGTVTFTLDGRGRHMRNWFIDHDRNAMVFDAGNGNLYSLTDTERPSITFGESI